MVATVRNFQQIRGSHQESFVEELTQELSHRFRGFEISNQQIEAWEISFQWIWQVAQHLPVTTDPWLFFPEFSPPLSPIRPDVVIATGTATAIIEFKTGTSKVGKPARNQLQDYAREMHNTMLGVRDSTLFALLVSPALPELRQPAKFATWEQTSTEINEIHSDSLPEFFHFLAEQDERIDLNLDQWMRATYDLNPDIVRAASELIAHVEDRGVTTHLSDDIELDAVRNEVIKLINDARTNSKKRVILISGVPGAGKTLVGLRLAHDPELHDSLPKDSGTPLYLTGNGPLVEVLVEAIARDDKRRNPWKTMRQARSEAGSKIKLVHGITDKGLPINAHVAVFDEGQRVWTADQMRAKGKHVAGMSEGEVILKVLEKHGANDAKWAVLVVLIGTGQEINRGEAGASVWSDAVTRRISDGEDWDIYGSSELARSLGSPLHASANLHLNVSRRALSAATLSQWVGLLLDGQFDDAKKLRESDEALGKFPLVVTRDLERAREWIRDQAKIRDGSFKPSSGLVASSKSARLRAFGLTVGTQPRSDEVNWVGWFLDDENSLNASSRLEVAASEFKTQGLELDFVGVAWSWDLILNPSDKWITRRIDKRNARWNNIQKDSHFLLNSYRVLLTRCREGMVIYVPRGQEHDSSLIPAEIDKVFNALIRSGVQYLD
jgi:hypothetical protein